MKILIFQTDIQTRKKIKAVSTIFNNRSDIFRWSVDTEDIDNVLRIEADESLNEGDVINLTRAQGFSCEVLQD